MEKLDISTLEQTIERYPWFSLARLELFKKGCMLGEDHKSDFLKMASPYVYSRARLFEISRNAGEPAKHVPEQPMPAIEDLVVGLDVVHSIEQSFLQQDDNPEIESQDSQPIEVKKEISSLVAKQKEVVQEEPSEEISFEIEPDPLRNEQSPKIILAGGDYFNRNDFESLKLDTSKPLDRFIAEKPSLLRSNPSANLSETEFTLESENAENFEDSGFYTETLAKIYTEQGFYKRAIDVYAKLILLFPEKNAYFAALVQDLKSKHNQ